MWVYTLASTLRTAVLMSAQSIYLFSDHPVYSPRHTLTVRLISARLSLAVHNGWSFGPLASKDMNVRIVCCWRIHVRATSISSRIDVDDAMSKFHIQDFRPTAL
ncbi:hypothetical protein GY45DRAFT_1325124 [Cubamyces sp. BRFM 1775]|nr:hypothetical protein GY45DRAFT_1325124 [Cubamyces sp. BRFM 1775]